MDSYRPRRLRLMGDFANYTGPIGVVQFTDGISDGPVVWHEALRIGSAMMVEDADMPGYQISAAADMNRNLDRTIDDPIIGQLDRGEHVNAEGSPVVERYTREQLEAIADAKGLSGVRDLARRWGRTGRAISECIDAILEAQAQATAASEVK